MSTLSGFKIIELAGIGPAPMAGMILADMGAEVIRVERANAPDPKVAERVSGRGKKSIVLDLKKSEGVSALLRLIDEADVLIDPFRPGVCEKLGIGPDDCLSRNPKLVFARMTGWGQKGPLARAAGHDINYIAITGALYGVGRAGQKPVPPLNLVGDMGGGGMLLVSGILAALLEASRSGEGQVIDAAMVDGAAQLMWMFHGLESIGGWDATARGSNMLDGAAHFYDVYECADGKYICIGAIEPQFYALLRELLGLEDTVFDRQHEREAWSDLSERLSAIFLQKSQEEWCALMEGTDVCFAPVLTFKEAPNYPPNVERETYIEVDGLVQPAPAPRFSRTPSNVKHGVRGLGEDTESVLTNIGMNADEIKSLRSKGVIGE